MLCYNGAGYAALHSQPKNTDSEDYPDIHKMAILADVAPYSREYHNVRQRVAQQAQGDSELEIEYEKIMNRVKQTRESIIRMTDRHFTAPVDEIYGTVNEASAACLTLQEYPGRRRSSSRWLRSSSPTRPAVGARPVR